MKKRAKKKKRGTLYFLLFLTIAVSVIVTAYFSKRTIPNEEGKEGNSACNLYNGGIFCEDEDRIYFSNLKDGGALYSMNKEMEDFKYLYEDRVGYLNNTKAYLVYSRLNHTRHDSVKRVLQFSTSGLYRWKKNGRKNIKSIYYSNIGAAALSGNEIYYQRLEKNGKLNLYRAGLDGKKNELLIKNSVVPGTVTKDRIYYSGRGKDHYIYFYDKDEKRPYVVYKGNCHNPALVGEHIYFVSISEGNRIARVGKRGEDPTILTGEKCSFYNVTPDERYLIYQVDDMLNNRLEIMDLLSLEKKVVKKGDYNSIHLIGDRVFFREYGTDEVYFFSLKKPEEVEVFDPPDLTEE